MTKFSLLWTLANNFLKSKEMRFLSKMLKASAMTIDGIKMTLLPFSQLVKISQAFELIRGLSVNHQSRACVSVTKFMYPLHACLAVEGFLGSGYVGFGDVDAFKNSLKGYNFFACWGELLENRQL